MCTCHCSLERATSHNIVPRHSAMHVERLLFHQSGFRALGRMLTHTDMKHCCCMKTNTQASNACLKETLKQACPQGCPKSAMHDQEPIDSRNSAVRSAYHTSLRPSLISTSSIRHFQPTMTSKCNSYQELRTGNESTIWPSHPFPKQQLCLETLNMVVDSTAVCHLVSTSASK